MNPILWYCYDAYCGWCYGFSKVIKQIAETYPNLQMEVLSGGMILPAEPVHISATAQFMLSAYKTVEAYSGIRFGADYLWHLNNPSLSDWYPNSEKSAIALAIIKENYPDKQLEFAADLQYALHYEGRDLTDNESYRHLLEKYPFHPGTFYEHLNSERFKAKAYEEFEWVKKLKVSGYPCLLLQISPHKFHLLTHGYSSFETVKENVDLGLNSTH